MKKLMTLLTATLLIAGCSSGGGTTSSGDGLGIQTTTSNLLLSASLIATANQSANDSGSGSFSVDAFQNICNGQEVSQDPETIAEFEPGLTTTTGQLTITSRDLMDASGLTPVEFFPEGVTFNRYQVSFTSPNSFAPKLRNRVFQDTFTLLNGTSTGTFTVILVDLDVILAEFQVQSSQSIASYNVKVTAFGAEFNGEPISVSAETFLEIGNFDRC